MTDVGVEAAVLPRPMLRGTLHAVAFVVSCVVGALFVAYSPPQDAFAGAVFAISVSVMLGTSALYHRFRWSESCRPSLLEQ